MPRMRTSAIGAALLALGAVLVLGGSPPPEPFRPTPAASIPSLLPASGASGASAAPTAGAASTAIPAIPEGYRVAVPRLGIDLPIAEGDLARDAERQATPEGYAFHFPGSGLPGDDRNCYLYAHARPNMFLALWDVRIGDVILITTPRGGQLRYVVEEIHPRVPPSDLAWTQGTPPARLTLQTSTGPNAGDPRFVVVARPAG